MIYLHPQNPELILLHGKELKESLNEVWPYFLEFCIQRRPMPEFNGGTFNERAGKILAYFKDTFTQEKDLILWAENNAINGFALFDAQNWSLEGELPDKTVELVIVGALSKDLRQTKKTFAALVKSYKNHKGCDYIGMNIRREWKKRGFKRTCFSFGFKQQGENLFVI